ncbi:hypothetical protein HYPSUDRAFT_200283 [Hypholoma sublateritium FD-334 SS-4]|uniref:Nitrogen regulatory protein areA GATA-like domain-containing protein n=1 Tax=Hypholoma sublateritium (strain FD-334 SS-4) TaxID=945553 RepID=A0A0D2P1G3_HYPSF|nr:hypothetical protein HYPSUDRAFT_200283 [Hypholoma sublateritium FD-334 SS-4]
MSLVWFPAPAAPIDNDDDDIHPARSRRPSMPPAAPPPPRPPVLAVAPAALRALDGPDALAALWTVFAKCKSSLADGAQLENLAWRLWARELAAPDPHPALPSAAYPPYPSAMTMRGPALPDGWKTALGGVRTTLRALGTLRERRERTHREPKEQEWRVDS